MPEYPISKIKKLKYKSPSGFVNVGKYIPPFEKVKDGYGFMGVVIEDFVSGKLQCHICGGWYEVFNSHLSSVHKINSAEYRKRFGLSVSTALKSKRVRLIQSKVMTGMRKSNKKYRRKFEKNNPYAANRKDKPKSLETINKYGICDLQIADKILKLKKKLKKTPTLIDVKNEYGGSFVTTIHNRYEGYINLCKQLSIEPNFSNHYPKYSREYFIEKGLNNEPSFKILTISEGRHLYKFFKSVKEWQAAVENLKLNKLQKEVKQ